MEFIKDYTLSLIFVSVLSILLEILLPQGNNKKYIHMLIGLLVMIVMLRPMTKLPHYNETFVLPKFYIGEDQWQPSAKRNPFIEQFQQELALTISRDINITFNKRVHCRVIAGTDENENITHIRQVILSESLPEAVEYLTEKYGLMKGCITYET